MPSEVRRHFDKLRDLVTNQDSWDVSVAWAFVRVEVAKNTAIYCGLVKRHRTDAELTRKIVYRQHVTRDSWKALFRCTFGRDVPEATMAKIDRAERVRDRVVHGKRVGDADLRNALADVLDFASELNELVGQSAGFRPFGGELRGFKGAADGLGKETTRWVLKGMGFAVE